MKIKKKKKTGSKTITITQSFDKTKLKKICLKSSISHYKWRFIKSDKI